MKAKIIATPVKQRALRICFEQVPNGQPFINNCFALSYWGLMKSEPDWHSQTISKAQKKQVFSLATNQLEDLPYKPKQVYEWEPPQTLSSFQDIFNEKNRKGYLIYLNFSDKESGHVLALKFREESWRFMDPQVVEINKQTGYFHAQLNDEGKMAINESKEIDVLEYIFLAYPSTIWIGVIALSDDRGSFSTRF